MIYRIVIVFIFVSLSIFCHARKTMVTSASAINNGTWLPGDTLLMRNGTWSNQVISLTANGTASNPVVLLAETPGRVILNGSSRLAIGGSYVVVSGLFFQNGTLSGSAVVEFKTSVNATRCTLKNTAIVNYNPSLNTVDSKWVSLFGTYNTVENCSFENKTNSGTLLVVWLTSGVAANHTIASNYFGYRNSNLDANGAELNGQEIIRIGDSSTSMTFANCTIKNNFFEKCNGEIEVISNKSCGNVYSNNLFLECKGMLTLRHGNNCIVEGNYFLGNGEADTGGVRIIGENHQVYNNYFENLKGSGYRAALCMVRGKQNSALNEYFQVKNALVAFNTMVNCYQSFSINYNSSTSLTLPPINSVIAHNHVYNTNSSNNNVTIDQNYLSAMSISWKNNLMNQGRYSGFSYNSTQVITGKDAKMISVGTTSSIFEPSNGSALANYNTNEYADILRDIRGRDRSAVSKLPGASEISGNPIVSMPSKTNVGAVFFNNPTADVPSTSSNEFKMWQSNNQLFVLAQVDTVMNVYCLTGALLYSSAVPAMTTHRLLLSQGMYIASIQTNSNIKTQKIYIN